MTVTTPTRRGLQECLAQPTRVVGTSVGPVEYAERGTGPAVLLVHGTPGGWDQGLVGFEFATATVRVISPSRPGYLGTPLATGRTAAEQADALAALLDALRIDSIPVVGASGGGPASYLLAARHPERVRCLVEVDSLCLPYPKPGRLEMALTYSPLSMRLLQILFDRFPAAVMRAMLASLSTLDEAGRAEQARRIAGDPDRVALMHAMLATMSRHAAQRQAGVRNDLTQFAAIDQLPLEAITCPTLIVHGAADRDVTTQNATHAHSRIPTSELYWIPDGSHLALHVDDDAGTHQQHVLDYLIAHGSG
jgi:pimeloyl-ACP methyl ester carboxylesterase